MGKNRGLKEIAEQQIKTIHVSFTLREITLLGLSNGPDDSEAPHVNLKYYDPRHECFSCWEPNELGGFSSFCVKLTQMKWAEIYKSGGQVGHKTGLGYTIHKDLSKLPNNPALGDLSQDLTWFELRIDGDVRVHGFRSKSAFFLVFLDREHKIYR